MPIDSTLSREARWEWAQAVLLAVNLVWTTACLGGFEPRTMVITATLTAALLAVHCAGAAVAPRRVEIHPASGCLLPFLAYAAVNVVWVTPVPWLGWIDWFNWAQLAAVFWVALNGVRSARGRRFLFHTLVAIAMGAVVLGIYQRFVVPEWLMLGRVQADQFLGRASGPFGIPNSLAAELLLLLPACGAQAWRAGWNSPRGLGWTGVTLFLGFGLVLTISRGAWIALALALTTWPLLAMRGSWLRRGGAAVAASLAVLVLSAGVYAGSARVRERAALFVRDAGELSRPILWRAAGKLWSEHPLCGTGAGSFNVRFEPLRPEGFRNEPQWAHNEYLNTLSDYGAIGGGLLLGAAAFVVWRTVISSRRRGKASPVAVQADPGASTLPAGAMGIGLLAFALQLGVDFHFKIPALALAFAVVAALAVGEAWLQVAPSEEAHEHVRRRRAGTLRAGPAVAGTLAAGVVLGWFVPLYRAEALRYEARRTIDRLADLPPAAEEFRARLAAARARLERAVGLHPGDGQAWADLAYARALWALVEPARTGELGRAAEAAATRALLCSDVVYEFWIRRGVGRDMQARWTEAGGDFAHALTLAPANAVAWFYHAQHQSRHPAGRSLAQAALEFCLRLDPQNRDALVLRQHLAIGMQAP